MPSEEKANKLLQLGIELAKAGEMDEALKLFGEALDIVPGNPVVNYNCGLAQQQAGSIEAAVIAWVPVYVHTVPMLLSGEAAGGRAPGCGAVAVMHFAVR